MILDSASNSYLHAVFFGHFQERLMIEVLPCFLWTETQNNQRKFLWMNI